MAVIAIRVPDFEEADEVTDIVRHVADQMDQGFTSGHINRETYWSIEEE